MTLEDFLTRWPEMSVGDRIGPSFATVRCVPCRVQISGPVEDVARHLRSHEASRWPARLQSDQDWPEMVAS